MPTLESVPAPAKDALLRCEHTAIGYRSRALLPAFDLEIHAGDFVAVVGRNGCGKSTWFKTVLGFHPTVSGRVIKKSGTKVAYIAQVNKLDPLLALRAIDVVAWGQLRGWNFFKPGLSRAARQAALDKAEAGDLGDKLFRDLSEGQKQRVLFARLLCTDADLYFLDEPTSAMDSVAEQNVMKQLCALARDEGKAVVVVSHVLGSPAKHANKALFLDRDHQFVRFGTAAEVFADEHFQHHFGDLWADGHHHSHLAEHDEAEDSHA